MKRILFCSPVPLDPRLGMGKHWLDLVESFRYLGWEANAAGPDEIAGGPIRVTPETFPAVLRDYLRRNAADYDVVEFDHVYLPFPRSDFPPDPLFVARCMLLHHHLLSITIPPIPGFLPGIRHALNALRRRRHLLQIVAQTNATVRHADLTVVCNAQDAAALIGHGNDPGRITVLPLGLTSDRLRRFAAVPDAVPNRSVVGFVGTFDPRKGMREFPRFVERVACRIPGVTFRLLGTAGLVPDADGVRRSFPRRLWPRLEIHPRYHPDELPGLLDGISVGVFPSRVEGFPYGVIEMLAAAIPVIAYDAPGPPEMLLPEFLVPIGAVDRLADRVCDLLIDPDRLRTARLWARTRAADFRWEEIAARTASAYLQEMDRSGQQSRLK